MAQVKAVFYIPLRDNDGRDLRRDILDLEGELYLRFVGWSCLGLIKGAWKMADGSQSLDDSFAYSLILDELRIPELEQVLLTFKSKTTQEAIYLEVHRQVEIHYLK